MPKTYSSRIFQWCDANGYKIKTKQTGFYQTKIFCIAKETQPKTKGQLTEWEKLFVINKSKILKVLTKINPQNILNSHQTMGIVNEQTLLWGRLKDGQQAHKNVCCIYHQGNPNHNMNEDGTYQN